MKKGVLISVIAAFIFVFAQPAWAGVQPFASSGSIEFATYNYGEGNLSDKGNILENTSINLTYAISAETSKKAADGKTPYGKFTFNLPLKLSVSSGTVKAAIQSKQNWSLIYDSQGTVPFKVTLGSNSSIFANLGDPMGSSRSGSSVNTLPIGVDAGLSQLEKDYDKNILSEITEAKTGSFTANMYASITGKTGKFDYALYVSDGSLGKGSINLPQKFTIEQKAFSSLGDLSYAASDITKVAARFGYQLNAELKLGLSFNFANLPKYVINSEEVMVTPETEPDQDPMPPVLVGYAFKAADLQREQQYAVGIDATYSLPNDNGKVFAQVFETFSANTAADDSKEYEHRGIGALVGVSDIEVSGVELGAKFSLTQDTAVAPTASAPSAPNSNTIATGGASTFGRYYFTGSSSYLFPNMMVFQVDATTTQQFMGKETKITLANYLNMYYKNPSGISNAVLNNRTNLDVSMVLNSVTNPKDESKTLKDTVNLSLAIDPRFLDEKGNVQKNIFSFATSAGASFDTPATYSWKADANYRLSNFMDDGRKYTGWEASAWASFVKDFKVSDYSVFQMTLAAGVRVADATTRQTTPPAKEKPLTGLQWEPEDYGNSLTVPVFAKLEVQLTEKLNMAFVNTFIYSSSVDAAVTDKKEDLTKKVVSGTSILNVTRLEAIYKINDVFTLSGAYTARLTATNGVLDSKLPKSYLYTELNAKVTSNVSFKLAYGSKGISNGSGFNSTSKLWGSYAGSVSSKMIWDAFSASFTYKF